MVRVVEMGPWEMFDLSDGKWHILYDAWQPEDFELLAAASIEPTSVLMSDKTRRYQDVIRRSDRMHLRIYF